MPGLPPGRRAGLTALGQPGLAFGISLISHLLLGAGGPSRVCAEAQAPCLQNAKTMFLEVVCVRVFST